MEATSSPTNKLYPKEIIAVPLDFVVYLQDLEIALLPK